MKNNDDIEVVSDDDAMDEAMEEEFDDEAGSDKTVVYLEVQKEKRHLGTWRKAEYDPITMATISWKIRKSVVEILR